MYMVLGSSGESKSAHGSPVASAAAFVPVETVSQVAPQSSER
jgi:hypothetical protein